MRIPDFIRDADAGEIAYAFVISLSILAFIGLLFLACAVWGFFNVMSVLLVLAAACAAITACVLYLMDRF